LNSIIKSHNRTGSPSGTAQDVKPVDLVPIGPYIDDLNVDLDLSRVKDPVLRAQIEARGIMRDAQEEADGIRQEAHDGGFRAGVEQAAAIADQLIQRLESDIQAVAEDRATMLDAVEPQVLKLCLEIVEKVIRHEAKTDPRIVMRVLRSCLRCIKDSDHVCVRVSPEEVEAVRARRDELSGLAEGAGEIRIVDDRRVAPGGCVVESSAGDFDAKIESQLSKIDEKMRETLENDRDHEPTIEPPAIPPCEGGTKGGAEPGETLSGDQPA
jgi:flagellar assembly protein FliH